MISALRFTGRGLALIPYLSLGLLLVLAVHLDRLGKLDPPRLTQWWNTGLLKLLGLRLTVHGEPIATGHMSVANHVSWLDISVIAACERTRFVSKAEVQHWPVIGALATAAGSFYLARGKHGTRPLIEQLVPYLQGGGSLTIFPEGTTTSGEMVLPFHPRLFAAAIESERPVQPVVLRYGRAPDGVNIAPYVGDDVMIWHILRLLRYPAIGIEVTFLPAIDPAGLDRSELAKVARAAIEAVLRPADVALPSASNGETLAAA